MSCLKSIFRFSANGCAIPAQISKKCIWLICTYRYSIIVCMKTTMNLRDELVKEAMAATGIREKTALVHLGLEELVQRAARERLIKMGGSDPSAKLPPRRRSATK
jgi:Arc/MetJ family transcription regulator